MAKQVTKSISNPAAFCNFLQFYDHVGELTSVWVKHSTFRTRTRNTKDIRYMKRTPLKQLEKNPSLVSPTFDIDQLAKNIKSNNIVGSIDRRLYFTFAEVHNYVFYFFWLIILKSSRGGGVGRLPYQNAWNIMLIILLKGGNADFGLNSGCWDRRAIYP